MAGEVGLFDQYTTVEPLFRAIPTWLEGQDQRRITSYMTYEQIYWNAPEAFRVVQRGDDAQPIYIPSGRQIVDTLHRFTANDLHITTEPAPPQPGEAAGAASDADIELADLWMDSLLTRERFYSRFSANKRYGIIRGDWLFHIYADPERDEGSRISILPVDPGSYFPLYNDDNIDEIIGCHIVDMYVKDNGDEVIRRLTYRKETESGGPSRILMSEALFEVDGWGQPGTDMNEVKVTDPDFDEVQDVALPDAIDSIPVYHIKNFTEPNNPFGSSELRGMEVLIGAINQAVSDEDLTLALEGLGVYRTTSGPPVDQDTGEEMPWNLGPAKVVEHDPETEFDRVSGVGSVAPFQDHIGYLHEQLDLGSGTPAVAKGDVDVQVAESGVALAIRMGPLLALAKEKEHDITDVLRNLLWDLRKWIVAYEGGPIVQAVMRIQWMPNYGDKLPLNREQRFREIMEMVDKGIVSLKWARAELEKLGYEIGDPEDMMNEVLEEKIASATVAQDAFGARVDNELGEAEQEETQ